MSQVTIEQVLDLYLGLLHNDGSDSPEALYLILDTKPTFQTQVTKLQDALAQGHGLSSLDLFNKDLHGDQDTEDQSLEEHNETEVDVVSAATEGPIAYDDGSGQNHNEGLKEPTQSQNFEVEAADRHIPDQSITGGEVPGQDINETSTNADDDAHQAVHDWQNQGNADEQAQTQLQAEEPARHHFEQHSSHPVQSPDDAVSAPATGNAEDPAHEIHYVASEELESSLSETVQGDIDFLDGKCDFSFVICTCQGPCDCLLGPIQDTGSQDYTTDAKDHAETAEQTPSVDARQDQETTAIPGHTEGSEIAIEGANDSEAVAFNDVEATFLNSNPPEAHLKVVSDVDDKLTADPKPDGKLVHINDTATQSDFSVETGSQEDESQNAVLEPVNEPAHQTNFVADVEPENPPERENLGLNEDAGQDGDVIDFEDDYEETEFNDDELNYEEGEDHPDATEVPDGGDGEADAEDDLEASLTLGEDWEEFAHDAGDQALQQDLSQKRTREEDDAELFNLASPDSKRQRS